jgi:hypothetical protein
VNNTSTTAAHRSETTTPILRSTKSYSNESSSTLLNTSYWKLDDLPDEQPLSSPRQTLFTLILYLLCALIAFTLLIILFAIIIFTYRKHCFPSSPMIDPRLEKTKQNNRIGIQIENLDRDIKTIDNRVRPCFE